MSISADIVLIFKLQDNITKSQLLQVLISLTKYSIVGITCGVLLSFLCYITSLNTIHILRCYILIPA